jgi:hypothetical protein
MNNLDFLGNKICDGDEIIFIERDYRNFMKGVVIKLSTKKATIEYVSRHSGKKYTTTRFYKDIIKIPEKTI